MKNTTKGFLAGAAGLGLILGGSTFALWTDSADMRDQVVQSGNLQVKVDRANWRDMSPDRVDAGHSINLRDFRIIPGDVIQAKFPVKVALEGDNMVAQLKLTQGGKRGGGNATAQDTEAQNLAAEADDAQELEAADVEAQGRDRGRPGQDLARGLKITYKVFDDKGRPVATGGNDGVEVHLASHDNRRAGDVTRVSRGGTTQFYVEVTVEFDKNTSERDLTQSQAKLAGADIQLKQIRKDVGGYTSGGNN